MRVTYFKSAAEFRQWLEKNHRVVTELCVGFYRKSSGKAGITYQEALDEALCFGWIDGLKKKLNDASYSHRFTPRKTRSIWSNVNTKRAEELRALGRMMPSGLEAFEARIPNRVGIYSYENRPREFDADLQKKFKANEQAWNFFLAQPPGHRRKVVSWVVSAKKEETRLRRLGQVIQASEQRKRLPSLD